MPVCTTCGTSYGSTVRICVHDGTPLVTGPTDDPYLGKLLDGKYRIDSFVNAGGMGSLYRAQHVMLDKTVAVKVIKSELVTSDDIVARFLREARAASNLHHPNIVSVYDLGQTSEGTLYIAMEFIDGPSLKQSIRSNGPLTPRASIDILRQVASALAAAHRKQIVHRDLKSDNLMLASEDGQTVVKLVDFGIAKTFDDSTQLTAAGYMLGTPNYMSPEQAAARPVDHRTDLYSLGVILYEMLTGKVPFAETALTTMLVRLATEVPPPPSARRPDGSVPPALDAVAMRCLEKDPALRFQSANEFIEALDRASAELDRGPAPPAAPIATGAETVVIPTHGRRVPTPPPIPAPIPPPVISQQIPAVPPRTEVESRQPKSGRNIAVLLLLLMVVAAAAIGGVILLRNNGQVKGAIATTQPPATTQPTATTQQPAPPSAPEPAAPATPAAVQARAPQETNVAPAPATVRQPPPPNPVTPPRADPPADRTSPAVPQVLSNAAPPAAPPVAAAPPPPAATPVPAPATQPAKIPVVSVTCQGVSDVCDAMRTEMVRALQANQVPDGVEIAVRVHVISERPSTQIGVPSIIRILSITLTGNVRGAAIALPADRTFEFDTMLGRPALLRTARQLASDTVEAVKTSATKNRN